jgi:hypothetical protein
MNYIFITLIIVIVIFLITKNKLEKYEESNVSEKSDFDIAKEQIIRKESGNLRQKYEKCCVKPCLARSLYLSNKDCEKIKKEARDNLQKYFELRWRDFEYNNGLYNYLDKNEENIDKYKKFKESTTLIKELDNLKPLPYPYIVKQNKSILSSYR